VGEARAVEVFNESVQYFALLQQEGKIEGFDRAVFMPHGPDNGGFFLLRGSAEQIDSIRREQGSCGCVTARDSDAKTSGSWTPSLTRESLK
jgi:hypothetical protein